MPPVPPADNFPHRQFAHYELLRLLGEGAMGVVYLARDLQIGRLVALKLTRFSDAEAPQLLQRFYREAMAAGRLSHPNICKVHAIAAFEGRHYLDMEYVEGISYFDHIEQHQPLDQRPVVTAFRKLANALEVAHQSGVVHRDLKPSNLMLRTTGEPVIMDFGLAGSILSDQPKLTRSGDLVGSGAYIPPEHIWSREEWTPASDVYSLGISLYQALCGRPPLVGTLISVLRQKIDGHQVPRPSRFRPDLDAGLEAVVLRMIAAEPAQRFARMRDVEAALEDVARRGLHPVLRPDPPALRETLPSLAAAKQASPSRERGQAAGGTTASAPERLLDANREELRQALQLAQAGRMAEAIAAADELPIRAQIEAIALLSAELEESREFLDRALETVRTARNTSSGLSSSLVLLLMIRHDLRPLWQRFTTDDPLGS